MWLDINGQSTKSNRLVRIGDELSIGRPYGQKQRVAIRALADRHLAKTEARRLYEDLTPAPAAEEIEVRRLERMYRATMTPPRAHISSLFMISLPEPSCRPRLVLSLVPISSPVPLDARPATCLPQ